MHFMLQSGKSSGLQGRTAKRMVVLSVMAQYYCQVIPVLEVPPSALHAAAQSGLRRGASGSTRNNALPG